MLPPNREFVAGMRDLVPLALGVAMYGLAFGVLAAQAQMSELQTGLMGALVFSGAAQIVAVERVVAGAGAATALLAGIALSLRMALMTASLRGAFAGRPFWQICLGAHLTTDENWALMHATRASGRQAGYWYLVGGGITLGVAWITSTVAGAGFARFVPEPQAIGMDFAFAAAASGSTLGLTEARHALPTAAASVVAREMTAWYLVGSSTVSVASVRRRKS